ncbi:MAG: 2Fe-2S iron-sulfur cluster-binding protein, partial [Phycisphaerae bacterium]|nr:2Fe-2S iron-sulfur cluster-binding protein [Phycisphaerae bacterium]MDW8263569.1 2Fe-2S iron-sulfur cluster-binding protein [Phycisphaerales bacterium]
MSQTAGTSQPTFPQLELSRRELIAGAVVTGVATTFPLPGGEVLADPPRQAGREHGSLSVQLNVNGKRLDLKIDPRATLLDTLRETLGLTGTKKGCDHGHCGACTVHIGGRRVLACLTLTAAVGTEPITTIEGLADG